MKEKVNEKNLVKALHNLQKANNTRWRHPPFLDTENAESIVRIKHYLDNPWYKKPPAINENLKKNQMKLYDTMKDISEKIAQFNHIYNNGKNWVQNKENVYKLCHILNVLIKKQEITDNETKERYKAFEALKSYYEIYEIVHMKFENHLDNNKHIYSALDQLKVANNTQWPHPPFSDTENARLIARDVEIIEEIKNALFKMNYKELINRHRLSDLREKASSITIDALKNKVMGEINFFYVFSQVKNSLLTEKIIFHNSEHKKNCTSDFIDFCNIKKNILKNLYHEIQDICRQNIWEDCKDCSSFSSNFNKLCETISSFHDMYSLQKWDERNVDTMLEKLSDLESNGIDVQDKKRSIELVRKYFEFIKIAENIEHSLVFYSQRLVNSDSINKEIAQLYEKAFQSINDVKNEYPEIFPKINRMKLSAKKEKYHLMAQIDSMIQERILDRGQVENIINHKYYHFINKNYKSFIELSSLYFQSLEDLASDKINFMKSDIWSSNFVGKDILMEKKAEVLVKIKAPVHYKLKHWNQSINEKNGSFDKQAFINEIQIINRNYKEFFIDDPLFIKLNEIVNRLTELKKINDCDYIIKICHHLPELFQEKTECKKCNDVIKKSKPNIVETKVKIIEDINEKNINFAEPDLVKEWERNENFDDLKNNEWPSDFSIELILLIQQAEKAIKIPIFKDAYNLWRNIPEKGSSITSSWYDYIKFLHYSKYSKNVRIEINHYINLIMEETKFELQMYHSTEDLFINKSDKTKPFPSHKTNIPTQYEFVCRYFLIKWYFKHNQISEANNEIKNLYMLYKLPNDINRLLCLLYYKSNHKCMKYIKF